MLREQVLELLDILLFPGFRFSPEGRQFRFVIRIRDVLIVPPKAVETSAEFVDQIVVLRSAGVSDVFIDVAYVLS